jgi:hypothetical protein
MPKKTTTYNRILKEFTKINNKLPEEHKLSIKQRRELIKNVILPKFKDTPQYKLRVKKIKSTILKEFDKIPPREICDLNYIDNSDFAFVEWYSLDETIADLVPDCVYVKVTAGQYGETKIFNTRNYEYGRKGVREIVETIRPEADNLSGKFIFSGIKKLRPRKRNDGTAENYYLDFVLFTIDSKGKQEAMGETDTVFNVPPKTRETRSKRAKVKKIIETKIKALKSKKDSRKRAKKTLQANIKKLVQISNKVAKRPTPKSSVIKTKQFTKTASLVEKYYAEGKITKAQYDKELDKILKQLTRDK